MIEVPLGVYFSNSIDTFGSLCSNVSFVLTTRRQLCRCDVKDQAPMCSDFQLLSRSLYIAPSVPPAPQQQMTRSAPSRCSAIAALQRRDAGVIVYV